MAKLSAYGRTCLISMIKHKPDDEWTTKNRIIYRLMSDGTILKNAKWHGRYGPAETGWKVRAKGDISKEEFQRRMESLGYTLE